MVTRPVSGQYNVHTFYSRTIIGHRNDKTVINVGDHLNKRNTQAAVRLEAELHCFHNN